MNKEGFRNWDTNIGLGILKITEKEAEVMEFFSVIWGIFVLFGLMSISWGLSRVIKRLDKLIEVSQR